MSANPSSAPICGINNDVLLCIFSFNGDMFSDEKALDTTRISSQVCRQWRDVMLESSSLWAKLIDIDFIYELRTDDWRSELIRRSGTAPLWILARINEPLRRYGMRFVELVTGNWHRIQKLVIFRYSDVVLPRSVMYLPAPELEHCEVPCRAIHRVCEKDKQTEPLFANHVPKLRTLHISSCSLDRKASWLCHLHSLVLDSSYNITAILGILAVTRSLQELKIDNNFYNSNMVASSHTIYLPHLHSVEYSGQPGLAIAIFSSVEMPMDCSLNIRLHCLHDLDHLIVDIFIQHAKRTLQLNTFNHAYLDYNQKYAITWKCETSSVQRVLGISLPLDRDSDANLLETFLKKLLPLDFTRITKLNFTANGRLNPYFGIFFSHLPSVEAIFTNLYTLSQLAHLQNRFIRKATNRPRFFFPILKVINIIPRDWWARERIYFINQIAAAYLLSRSQEGHPITTLDMARRWPLNINTHPDLRTLAGVNGLKVLYRLAAVEGIVEHTQGRFGDMYHYNVPYL